MEEEQAKASTSVDSMRALCSTEHYFEALPKSRFFGGEPRGRDHIVRLIRQSYQTLNAMTGTAPGFESAGITADAEWFVRIVEILKRAGFLRYSSVTREKYNDAPGFYRALLWGQYPAGSTDGSAEADMYGSGISTELAEAMSKSIGEFFERYFLTLYKEADLTRASVRSLKKRKVPFLDPAETAGYSGWQKQKMGKSHWTDDSEFLWEKGERLDTGARVLIPAQFIYWNYASGNEWAEPYLRERNTNGCGGGFTRAEAILSGLYELIQRDAFMIRWLKKMTPIKIDPETIPDPVFQQLYTQAKKYHFEVHCLDITLDIPVPCVAVILADPTGKGPYLSLGGGCQADPAKAFRRALEEGLLVNYMLRKKMKPFKLPENYVPFEDRTVGQWERLLLWADTRMNGKCDFFLGGHVKRFDAMNHAYPRHFSSSEEELAAAVSLVGSMGNGYETYAFCPEHPILKETGYASARVVVPELVPLYLHEHHAPLGSKRLQGVSPGKGRAAAAQDLNPLPHPFP